MKELFNVYGFSVKDEEDITKNVFLAEKKRKRRVEESQYEEFLLDEIH